MYVLKLFVHCNTHLLSLLLLNINTTLKPRTITRPTDHNEFKITSAAILIQDGRDQWRSEKGGGNLPPLYEICGSIDK